MSGNPKEKAEIEAKVKIKYKKTKAKEINNLREVMNSKVD